ncbi:hypothetical protein P280DRAFT_456668 [Massarina eburnea CBS 473.64]|uniref:Uncharacterized protein n=1 Tax=Massarina eburnea CBS 473.64 TaxID=1395130 RepID=A0A6A6RR80_9PLEO|nr:hypothetical protein P280DRAFT_456668 [Massarina eburnea CBS 473.64]
MVTTTQGILALVGGYLVLCKALRYRRRNAQHAKFPYKNPEDFSKMTAEDAFEIVRYVMSLEFPFTGTKALEFALFRTYGIPTISKLLAQTQQLSTPQYAARRYADTGILIGEFLAQSPTSERANAALARLNFLHGRYQKAGKISNDDLLYTLALFVLEVERWIRLYEWRSLTPMEICAFGTHWKSIGDAMGIQYDDLAHGPSSFTSGYEFFQDIQSWAQTYEEKHMVPDPYNRQLANETVRILTANVPNALMPQAEKLVVSLMYPRLRAAMLYDAPAPIYTHLTEFALNARKFVLRHLTLPRPECLRFRLVSEDKDPVTGRYQRLVYSMEPWYVPADGWNWLSPLEWFRWATGRAVPNGKQYKPTGFKISEIGPAKMEGKGIEECSEEFNRLMSAPRGACPFAFK